MSIPIWLEHGVFTVADAATAAFPRPVPARTRLLNCHVVAHRGMRGDGLVENTLPAFERALDSGVWGIEFDVRWTHDGIPVVAHDADCKRVFGSPVSIGDSSLSQLRRAVPNIPTLEQVVERIGKRTHLMIELKSSPPHCLGRQHESLACILSPLTPAIDFHLLAFEQNRLESLTSVPNDALLALARLDLNRKGKMALEFGYGGLLGHHALVSNSAIVRHNLAGQAVGTGFVDSRNCFFREINRGVRWIFTNACADLMELRHRLLDHA